MRTERLAGEFQKEIYAAITGRLRFEFPELSPIISVTAVDVAPDLKSAKVFISIFDTDETRKNNSYEIISQNSGLIRHELSKVMQIRTVPELRFKKDGSMEYGEKIDKILSNLDKDEK